MIARVFETVQTAWISSVGSRSLPCGNECRESYCVAGRLFRYLAPRSVYLLSGTHHALILSYFSVTPKGFYVAIFTIQPIPHPSNWWNLLSSLRLSAFIILSCDEVYHLFPKMPPCAHYLHFSQDTGLWNEGSLVLTESRIFLMRDFRCYKFFDHYDAWDAVPW